MYMNIVLKKVEHAYLYWSMFMMKFVREQRMLKSVNDILWKRPHYTLHSILSHDRNECYELIWEYVFEHIFNSMINIKHDTYFTIKENILNETL